jgi:DNA end-binding protein Ku
MAALTETKRAAIAKVALHNREHLVLIRPGDGSLVLHTLYLPARTSRRYYRGM